MATPHAEPSFYRSASDRTKDLLGDYQTQNFHQDAEKLDAKLKAPSISTNNHNLFIQVMPLMPGRFRPSRITPRTKIVQEPKASELGINASIKQCV